MADQHRIRLVGIQRAVGLVGDAVRPELDAAVQPQRPLDAQDRVAALGERLAFGFGEILEHLLLHVRRSNEKAPDRKGGGFFEALRPFSED